MPRADTLTDFTRRTLAHIRLGGWPVILRKLKSALLRLVLPVVAMICAPLLVVLRPIFWVRFGMIYGTRIGHMSYRLAYYLAERELGVQPQRAIDIFFVKGIPANQTVARLIQRSVITSDLAQPFFRIYSRLPWMKNHIVRIRQTEQNRDRDLDGVLARTAPHVRLSPDEETAGQQALNQHGIADTAHWVCFLARDPAYLRDGLASGVDDKWREQEKRHGHRNMDAQTFLPAMEALATQGIHSLRMGAAVERPLQSANPLIHDYANSFRSDQLDVYLVSRCDFMVSSGSGLDALTDLFRRPVVFVNHVTLEAVHCWLPNITILKRYRNRATGKIMTFSEIVAADAGRIFDAREYDARGIDLIDNSPEEIRDATYEMMARLNGTWQDAPGDAERQARFWEILAGSPLRGPRHGRIGANFLRDHDSLLA